MLQERPGRLAVGPIEQLGHGKLACAVNADEREELDLSGLHLGYVDVDGEETDG